MINILLATPTAKHKDYCAKEFIDQIIEIKESFPANIGTVDLLIVDNSKDSEYHKRLVELLGDKGEVIYYKAREGQDMRDYMTDCNNIIRDRVLTGGYNYLFSLESDIFCPKNTLEYLLIQKRKVIGLPYFTKHNYYSQIMVMETDKFGLVNLTKYKTLKEAFLEFEGKVQKEYMIGLGCLLIHRLVLEKIKFRVDLKAKEKGHADTYFHIDLRKQGIDSYLATSYYCHHQNSSWYKIYQKDQKENQ